MFDMLRRVLYGDAAVGAGGSQQLEDSVSGLPGYDPETDSFSPAPGDMNMNPLVATGLGRRAALAEEARNQAGTGLPPYLGGPPSSEPPREPWEFEGMRHGGAVQGMAYGGVPRGTVAGELEPRGYLTARQAGATMRERAKGLRDRRNYGGGIGSL